MGGFDSIRTAIGLATLETIPCNPVTPGHTHGNNYIIRPPTNRNYGAFNTTTTER